MKLKIVQKAYAYVKSGHKRTTYAYALAQESSVYAQKSIKKDCLIQYCETYIVADRAEKRLRMRHLRPSRETAGAKISASTTHSE